MKKVIFFILIAAAILVSVWFKDGYILGTAEDGLIFYNISRYFHQSEYTWMEYPGLGSPSLTLVAGKQLYLVLSFLQGMGIPGFLVQAGVMWLLLSSAGIGIYLLTRELFPKLPHKYILLSVLFYWFNPISLVGVWNRFLLNYIFFFALLPISSYFYFKGLKSGKYVWILALNASLIFYSYAFSYIAFTILFWIWLSISTILFVLINKKEHVVLFYLKYFSLNLLLFALVNLIWILPLISLNLSGGSSPTANLFINQDNLGILEALSKKMGNLTDILKLTNASFLDTDSLNWVKLYYSPLVSSLLYVIVGIILYSFIRLRKDKSVLFLAALFFLAVFLVKGINPPFGEIYKLIFKEVAILQVFRNPFEKFGFLLSLVASVLVGMSIYEFKSSLGNKFGKYLYLFFILAIFFILGFPLYTSLAFTNKFPPTDDYSIGYKVKVPEYYKDVDNWLNTQGNNFRYIGLPLKDEGITYIWEKGYAGVELPVALFKSSGIIHTTSVPFFNQIVPQIEKTLLSDSDFSTLANLINAKYYLLRYDIDHKLRAMTDPAIVEQALINREKSGEVKKVAQFGQVSIWENLKWQDSTFYIARNIEKVKNFDNAKITNIDISLGDILIEENISLNIQGIDQNILPSISYEKINSTKYVLDVKNSSGPFLLSFSELYNNGWNASYNNGQVVTPHMRANLYGNGWVIDREGDFEIIVEFAPQKWMDLGEKISVISTAGLFCILIYSLWKRKT